MTYKPFLAERALAQLGGFPVDALGALAQVMAVVCEDPRDPLVTLPTDDPEIRRAPFGGHGLVTFLIVEPAQVVRITDITWVG
ncbi:hypothetical protein SAMN04489712_109166 [Thermomonospora echinospora]|uniref:Uncharacterized protein n=1 Tax=Thermomonospora echinospora TaxID=1992 RepID=A0A1H6CBR2_9ACTN|nr:hypothetical protein [Thermomonospora echinospora]SEG70384.1 hypothetical protein SAMN04489712_109166 [Thermomonospora echinospora]